MRKNIIYFLWFSTSAWIQPTRSALTDFYMCHEDFTLKPKDGVLNEYTFPWLGFVQYIHDLTHLLHPRTAPRMVLIQRQFGLTLASIMLHPPKNYKLGNAIFGDYERDPTDCNLPFIDAVKANKCPRVYLEIPLIDVIPHPEFLRFHTATSVALVKLLRPLTSKLLKSIVKHFPMVSRSYFQPITRVYSEVFRRVLNLTKCNVLTLARPHKLDYMIPICLPTTGERVKLRRLRNVYLIDYMSSVPLDFNDERMAKRTLTLYTHKECESFLERRRLSTNETTQIVCSSGCGMRIGSPIIIQASNGRFEVIGLSLGNAPCSGQAKRLRVNDHLPIYIDVHPYSSWIVNIITAHVIPKSYTPHALTNSGDKYQKQEGYRSQRKSTKQTWIGRTLRVGKLKECAGWTDPESPDFRDLPSLFFYRERFDVQPRMFPPPLSMKVNITIDAGFECEIDCVRINLPTRLPDILVTGLGTSCVQISFRELIYVRHYRLYIGLTGVNSTTATG